jgi:hypothetical protein
MKHFFGHFDGTKNTENLPDIKPGNGILTFTKVSSDHSSYGEI